MSRYGKSIKLSLEVIYMALYQLQTLSLLQINLKKKNKGVTPDKETTHSVTEKHSFTIDNWRETTKSSLICEKGSLNTNVLLIQIVLKEQSFNTIVKKEEVRAVVVIRKNCWLSDLSPKNSSKTCIWGLIQH